MWKIELWWNNEVIKPVEKTGISEWVENYKNIMEQTKKKVEILKFLDELEVPEDKQDKYLKEILKYNIFDKVQYAFDENDLIKIIKKERKIEEKKRKVEEKENIDKQKQEELIIIKNSLSSLNLSDYWDWEKTLEEYLNNWEYDKVIEILKSPKTFVKIADDLGWPWSEKYEKFKENLQNIDPSFEKYFSDYENIKSWKSLSADKVIEWIERDSWGLVDIDLGERPPISRLRLLGIDYGFDKEINKKALAEITNASKEELNKIKEFGFDILQNFKQNFAKETFDFRKMQDMYDYFEIREIDQIQLNDLEDFKNAKTKEEKRQIFEEKIKPKIIKIEKIIKEKQSWILKQYEEEIKEIVLREKIRKKEQLETLKFLHQTGFDLIPQPITDQLINEYRHNVYDIPGLDLNPERLDLANWMFWEEPTEEGWTKWKQNLVKILNKFIYWKINLIEPSRNFWAIMN